MKKLMFGAALAATSMAFADTSAGQVYDVKLSIKSTAAAKATINNKTNPFLGEDKEEVIYRKQASYTWKGLIWGCSCEGIDGVWEEAYTGTMVDYSSIKGCILWDTKAKEAVYIGNGADINDPADAVGKGFGWDFINAIDKNGKKVEGSWAMTQEGTLCDDPATLFEFRGAGFGSLNIVGTDTDSCGDNYLKSISGNFAGWMVAPDETSVKNPTGCMFCGYEEGSSECQPSVVWDYCPCLAIADDTRTAAYGTWSVKYNSSLSKKLSKPLSVSKKGVEGVIVSITDVYNFKSLPLVAAKITAIENAIWEFDPTGCDELEVALAEANKAVAEAEAGLDAVQYDNLKKAEIAANANVIEKTATNDAAQVALQYATEDYEIANAAYEKALYWQTNVNATVIWKNASQTEVTNKMVGCTAIEAFVVAHNDYTLVKMETAIPGLYDIRTCTSWAACTALVKEYTDATATAKEALVKAEAAVVSAKADAVTAATALEVAKDALVAAQNNLANITVLQYEAEKALEKAETAQAAAQKAYDDAGCGDDE